MGVRRSFGQGRLLWRFVSRLGYVWSAQEPEGRHGRVLLEHVQVDFSHRHRIVTDPLGNDFEALLPCRHDGDQGVS